LKWQAGPTRREWNANCHSSGMLNVNTQTPLRARGEMLPNFARCEDAILIGGAIAGQSDCFAVLVDRHVTALKRRLAMMIPNDADLEDTLQDVLLKIWQHLTNFRGESDIRTWMTRIAINQARARYRRKRSKPDCSSLDDFSNIRSSGELQDQSAMKKQAISSLLCAVKQLPRKYRDTVTLRDLQELSLKDAAELLETTPAATKTRQFRARILLATRLRHFAM
jgi:RNA polymerase sigma-70 factor (ECF subfamily)